MAKELEQWWERRPVWWMEADRIPAKKESCLTPTLMDEGQARNPNTTYNGYKMEFWKFALTWKLICPVQHKITQKEQKEKTKKGGISITIMGQRQTYTQYINPSGHPTKRYGLIRMTTHTECAMKQKFMNSWNCKFQEFLWS